MSLQRYEHYDAGMDKVPDGEFVLLADVVKLLTEQPHHMTNDDIYPEPCWCDYSYGDAIALIKGQKDNETVVLLTEGEQKSQSEHLTDAVQATVWAYEEGEQK